LSGGVYAPAPLDTRRKNRVRDPGCVMKEVIVHRGASTVIIFGGWFIKTEQEKIV